MLLSRAAARRQPRGGGIKIGMCTDIDPKASACFATFSKSTRQMIPPGSPSSSTTGSAPIPCFKAIISLRYGQFLWPARE